MARRHVRGLVCGLLLMLPAARAYAGWRRLDQVRGFPGLRAELQSVVDEGGSAPVNHFCVIVAQNAPSDRSGGPATLAYAHWEEGHYMLAYLPTRLSRIDGTSQSGADSFDLRTEVYPTWSAVKGVRGVSRRFADAIVLACQHKGDKFVLVKHRG